MTSLEAISAAFTTKNTYFFDFNLGSGKPSTGHAYPLRDGVMVVSVVGIATVPTFMSRTNCRKIVKETTK